MLSATHILLLKEHFIYDKEWYEFENHYWHKIEEDKVLGKMKAYIPFKKHIPCKEIRAINHLFKRTFDKDPKHLICFTNGVYDFKLHQFRDGDPSDGCTLCTGIAYIPTYDDELWCYLHKVFPETEDYIQFIKTMNDLFKGKNSIIHGYSTGNHGISTLYRLIDMMYGSYGLPVPRYDLTDKKLYTSDTLLEDLHKNYKGRYIKFNTSILLFNEDVIYKSILEFASALICIGTQAINNEKQKNPILCQSNELIFKSQFLDYPNSYANQYHYPIDYKLTKKFPSFAATLMTKLISLQDNPIRYLYFYHNCILVLDVTQYILNIYLNIMYL